MSSSRLKSIEFIESYGSEIQEFQEECGWLFDFKMTRLFMNDVFKRMPAQWLDVCGKEQNNIDISVLHSIANAQEKDGWPESLRTFVRRCGRLRRWQRWATGDDGTDQDFVTGDDGMGQRCATGGNGTNQSGPTGDDGADQAQVQLPAVALRGISAKKQHEIERMVPALQRLSDSTDCGLVIDVGAGLGHLAECVRRAVPRLRVLALERAAGLVTAGAERLRARPDASCRACLRLTVCNVSASEECRDQLRGLATELSDSSCSCPDRCAAEPTTDASTPSGNFSSDASATGSTTSTSATYASCAVLPPKSVSITCASTSSDPSASISTLNLARDTPDVSAGAYPTTPAPSPLSGWGSCSSSARWCLTGLHTCGDLTPQLLQLAVQMAEVRSVLLLSCCYHRAAQPWRPLSRALAGVSLSPFALRLACQQSVAAWCRQSARDHQRHSRAAGWRAMLELVVARLGCRLRRRRRHPVDQYASFAEYAADMLEPGDADDIGAKAGENELGCSCKKPEDIFNPKCLVCEDRHSKLTATSGCDYGKGGVPGGLTPAGHGVDGVATGSASGSRLAGGWTETVAAVERQCRPLLGGVELLAALQACVQPVLEGVLLLDRLLLAREHAMHARLLPLFDQAVSPRAWAILAWKP